MTDHELLELAAKAAGIGRTAWDYEHTRSLGFMVTKKSMWNPLEDDGEALRLAVKLGIDIKGSMAHANWRYAVYDGSTYAEMSTDHAKATRRAIVRAAAAIGESMP